MLKVLQDDRASQLSRECAARILGRLRYADAVEALISGRLDDAMEKYRQLHGIHPDDPSYDLAVELLERRAK